MAIGNRSTSTNDGTGTTLTISNHVVLGGLNTCLWVFVDGFRTGGESADPTGVTFNGVALTKIANFAGGAANDNFISLWRLIGPTPATANIVVTWALAHEAVAMAISYTGVNQTTPNDAVQSNDTTSTDPSHSVSSELNDMVVSFVGGWGVAADAWQAGGALTERLENSNVNTVNSAAVGDAPGGVSVTCTWNTATNPTDPHGQMSFNVNVAAGIAFVNSALGAATATTSFSVTLPETQEGDIIILEYTHRGTGDATLGGTYSGPAFTEKHDQQYATSTFSGKTCWSRATGNHSGQTVTGSGLTNSCAAIVTVYRGAKSSGDPLAGATIVGEQNASGNETQAEITTLQAGNTVVLVVANSPDVNVTAMSCTSPGALALRAELLSTGGTDTSIAHGSADKTAAGATGAFTWAQTNGASGSWAYAIIPQVGNRRRRALMGTS